MGIGIAELLVILVIALVIFGAKNLSSIGGALGKSIREFKENLNEIPVTAEKTGDSALSPPQVEKKEEPPPHSRGG